MSSGCTKDSVNGAFQEKFLPKYRYDITWNPEKVNIAVHDFLLSGGFYIIFNISGLTLRLCGAIGVMAKLSFSGEIIGATT